LEGDSVQSRALTFQLVVLVMPAEDVKLTAAVSWVG